MTTLVEAHRQGTKGKLVRLGGVQWVGWGMYDSRGSGRGGQGPRANFCGSGASTGWVGGWTTTVVKALRRGTKGKLLRLKGQQ